MIIQERLTKLATISLKKGKHAAVDDGMCAMEAASWIAGEPFSDRPKCACPIISEFMRAWNDDLPINAERDRLLKDLIPLTVDTLSKDHEEQRVFMCLDWGVRVFVPAWLDLTDSLKTNAEALRLAPEILSPETLADIAPIIVDAKEKTAAAWTAAKTDAWDATEVAAEAAAEAAAWAATEAAAWTAAWTAAWNVASGIAVKTDAGIAVWAAATNVMWIAVRAAARDAMRVAARDALRPIIESLQQSAAGLVRRMCALGQPACQA